MFKPIFYLLIILLLFPIKFFSQNEDNTAIDSLSMKLITLLKDGETNSQEDYYITQEDLISMWDIDKQNPNDKKIEHIRLKIKIYHNVMRCYWNSNFQFIRRGLGNYINNWDTLQILRTEIKAGDTISLIPESFKYATTRVTVNYKIDGNNFTVEYSCIRTKRGWVFTENLRLKAINSEEPDFDFLPTKEDDKQLDRLSQLVVKVFQTDDLSIIEHFYLNKEDILDYIAQENINKDEKQQKELIARDEALLIKVKKESLNSFAKARQETGSFSIDFSQIKYELSKVKYKVNDLSNTIEADIMAVFGYRENFYDIKYTVMKVPRSWVIISEVSIIFIN